MRSVERILIVKLSSFGDIVHALPVSAAIKKSFPHIQLSWAVEEVFYPLLEGNPYLDSIVRLPKANSKKLKTLSFYKDYLAKIAPLRNPGYDIVLDLQGLTKSAVVARYARAKHRIAYHWVREVAGLFVKPIPRNPENIHIVDQYLDVARFLGANIENPVFPLHIPEQDAKSVEKMLVEGGWSKDTPLVAINPASAKALKEWETSKFALLVNKLYQENSVQSVLVTADKKVAERVASEITVPFINLSGKTNLKQLAEVLRQSDLHLCSDTGSGHLAAALEKPVVALIGPTDTDRICPYRQRENVVQHREHCGERCTWHQCQYPQPKCMQAITVDEVYQKITTILSAKPLE